MSVKYRGSQIYLEKAKEIHAVLAEPEVDLWKLRELALSEGGLVNDDLRRSAWPKLVGLHDRLFEPRNTQEPDTKAALAAVMGKSRVVAADAASTTADCSTGGCDNTRETSSPTEHQPREPLHPLPPVPPPSRPPLPGSGGTPPIPPGQPMTTASPNSLSRLPASPGKSGRKTRGNINNDNGASTPGQSDECSVTSHTSTMSSRDKILAICDDFDQIERDVARCTWHLLTGTQRSVVTQMEHKRHKKIRRLIRRKQRRLANLINLTLQQSYPFLQEARKLRYYQGYHDVACVILSTLGGSAPVSVSRINYNSLASMASSMGLDLPSAVLLQLSQSHFVDCMKATFMQLQTTLRISVFPLIAYFDKQVHDHLHQAEMEPFFCLSWIITWFSHEIRDTELVKRLFDVFIVSHQTMPIYMAVAMVLHPHNRQDVLQTECDFSILHQTLQQLPRNSSMVGWKYRPGDGYVSDDDDDEDDDEDGTVGSEDIALETNMLEDLSFLKENTRRDEGATTASTAGLSFESSRLSTLIGAPPPVPFQELIEQALHYMERVPPHQLVSLAKRYYGEAQVDFLLSTAPDIQFLESAPEWALSLKAKADWVLKQQAREARVALMDRRGRRNEKKRSRSRSRSMTRRGMSQERIRAMIPTPSPPTVTVTDHSRNQTSVTTTTTKELSEEELIAKHLQENATRPAVIAAGHGKVPERKKRKRRNTLFLGALVAATVAVIVGYLLRGKKEKGLQPIVENVVHVSSATEIRNEGTYNYLLKEGDGVHHPQPILPDCESSGVGRDDHSSNIMDKTWNEDSDSNDGDGRHPQPFERLMEQTTQFVKRAQDELHDLPEPRFKELATSLWRGATKKFHNFKEHHFMNKPGQNSEKKDRPFRMNQSSGGDSGGSSLSRTKRGAAHLALSSAGEWENLGGAIREAFPNKVEQANHVIHNSFSLIEKNSKRLLRMLRLSNDWNDTVTSLVVHFTMEYWIWKQRFDEAVKPRLEMVPLFSIRMVQKLCKPKGDWKRGEIIPFFCQ